MSLVSGYAATYDLSTSSGGQLPVAAGFYGDTSAFYTTTNTWNDCNYLHLNHYAELDASGVVAPTAGGSITVHSQGRNYGFHYLIHVHHLLHIHIQVETVPPATAGPAGPAGPAGFLTPLCQLHTNI